MKDSKKYAPKIQKLYRSLKTRYPKVEDVVYDEPVEAVIYAILSQTLTDSAAHAAFRRFGDYFVDWNELRVTRAEEIASVIGHTTPETIEIGVRLGATLGAIFNDYHKVGLEALKKLGKRPVKQALEKYKGFSRYVVDYCMLTAFAGHAIPLTPTMIEFLKDNGLVHPSADEAEIEGFLGKQIPSKNGYEFYALLRKHAESAKPKKKKARAEKPQEAAPEETPARAVEQAACETPEETAPGAARQTQKSAAGTTRTKTAAPAKTRKTKNKK
ncbi:MAG TPA: hypothetical protein ENN81_05870 [Phycisphaerales bacterium]|nr:hypothetical protein [Phycisphaerales bacterium]